MKLKLILLLSALICFSFVPSGTSVYQLQFHSYGHQTISLNNFQGKKIITFFFDAFNPNANKIRFFDSLNKANQNKAVVLGIPATDFSSGGTFNLDSLSANVSFQISDSAHVKKGSINQHSLAGWLTDTAQNMHHSEDIVDENFFYIINEKGELIARLHYGKVSKDNFLNKIINQ
jgi:glutathione peroxidase-family protein